jgi:hypothetical protein
MQYVVVVVVVVVVVLFVITISKLPSLLLLKAVASDS